MILMVEIKWYIFNLCFYIMMYCYDFDRGLRRCFGFWIKFGFLFVFCWYFFYIVIFLECLILKCKWSGLNFEIKYFVFMIFYLLESFSELDVVVNFSFCEILNWYIIMLVKVVYFLIFIVILYIIKIIL